MYVTELILNQDNLFAIRDVADRYETHRSVERLTEGMERRVLWRLDLQREWRLTVQCERPLEPHYVSKAMPGYAYRVRSAEVAMGFNPGDLLLFQLEANPTVKRAKKRRALEKFSRATRVATEEVRPCGLRTNRFYNLGSTSITAISAEATR